MKSLLTLVLFILTLSATAQKENLIGTWSGESKGEVGTIIFDAEGYITFIIDGKPMGGKDFDMNGATASMVYSIDDSVEPHPILIEVKLNEVDQGGEMHGYISFIDDDTIKMGMGRMGGGKITGITEENSIVLSREK